MTRPSFPVACTFERSIPCRLAMLLTAGVANALALLASISALGVYALHCYVLYISTGFSCLLACVGASAVVAAPDSSSTSISTRALPTKQISSFLYLMLLMTPSWVEGIFATSLSVNTSHISSYYETIRYVQIIPL